MGIWGYKPDVDDTRHCRGVNGKGVRFATWLSNLSILSDYTMNSFSVSVSILASNS